VAWLEFAAPAAQAVEGIFDYTLENWGPAQADQYLTELMTACLRLSENPHLGSRFMPSPRPVRRFLINQHWCYYEPVSDGIIVLAIIHVRQEPDLPADQS
jgi:toxin ParE1/3/4